MLADNRFIDSGDDILEVSRLDHQPIPPADDAINQLRKISVVCKVAEFRHEDFTRDRLGVFENEIMDRPLRPAEVVLEKQYSVLQGLEEFQSGKDIR